MAKAKKDWFLEMARAALGKPKVDLEETPPATVEQHERGPAIAIVSSKVEPQPKRSEQRNWSDWRIDR